MPLFRRFHRWLSGNFTCRKCGREFYTMCFGYGEAICPDCYQGEQPFLFFDNTYWLNRITAHLLNHSAPKTPPAADESPLIHQPPTPPPIEMPY